MGDEGMQVDGPRAGGEGEFKLFEHILSLKDTEKASYVLLLYLL